LQKKNIWRFPTSCRLLQLFQNTLNDTLLNLSFFSDEVWFHLSGYVNSQNYRIWNSQNPYALLETPLHPQKVGVWLAVSRRDEYMGPSSFMKTLLDNERTTVWVFPIRWGHSTHCRCNFGLFATIL
jgi:hypothetical protein